MVIKRVAKKSVPPRVQRENLEKAIRVLADVNVRKAALEIEATEARELVTTLMEASGIKSTVVHNEDGTVTKATYVVAHRTTLDESSLQKKIGSVMWRKITSLTLDRRKLDGAIQSGEIDPMIVASVTVEVPNKPYVKVS